MIEKITLKNFKSHENTEIELGQVTVLVGPNGCGKTSFLKAVHCLSESVWRAWDSVFVGEQSPSVLVRKERQSFEIGATGANLYQNGINPDFFGWSVSIKLQRAGTWHARSNWVWMDEKKPTVFLKEGQSILEAAGSTQTEQEAAGSSETEQEAEGSTETEIVDSIYFQASLEKLKEPSHLKTLPLQIAPDGSGLASVLADLKTTENPKFGEIENDLRAIVPTIKRIKARRVQITLKEEKIISVNETRIPYNEPREDVGDELIFDTTSANEIPAPAMSDGTLLVLGIIALMHSPESPRLILLDDIERGLHPLAQIKLMELLKQFAETHNRQIIITSHSPYILDALEPKDVWVMDMDKEGISRCKRLSDHPDIEHAMQVLTTGEAWSASGEDWVLDQTVTVEKANA